MKRNLLTLAAFGIVSGCLLASPVAANSTAGKKPIRIDVRETGIDGGTGTFLLLNGSVGDGGKLTFTRTDDSTNGGQSPHKTPSGLPYAISVETATLTGKTGTLVIRAKGRDYEMGSGTVLPWIGTWVVVRGTGKYAGISGSGEWAAVANHTGDVVIGRYAGFVT